MGARAILLQIIFVGTRLRTNWLAVHWGAWDATPVVALTARMAIMARAAIPVLSTVTPATAETRATLAMADTTGMQITADACPILSTVLHSAPILFPAVMGITGTLIPMHALPALLTVQPAVPTQYASTAMVAFT